VFVVVGSQEGNYHLDILGHECLITKWSWISFRSCSL
jgi:hypothetical protein